MGIVEGALGVGSLIAGALGGKSKTTNTTSTSTPTYTAQQTSLQNTLGASIQDKLNNPANLDPLKTNAIEGVNRSYAGLQDRLQSSLAARGFGSSGKVVTGAKNLEIARAGDIGGLESKFAGLQLDQENHMFDLASRFAFANPGSTTNGTQTTPGNMLGAGIGSGVESISSLFFLNKLLKGGGGGGGMFGGGGDSGLGQLEGGGEQ
jgi:hypothetical protein